MSDPGAPRVTMKMIADRLRVSVSTVSLALREHPGISEETRARVRGAAKDMGFTHNPVVAQLMSELRRSRLRGGARTIALLNAHPRADAFADPAALASIAEGCRRRAAFQGYGCDSFWLHDPKLGPRSLGRILITRGIRGAIVIGLRDQAEVLRRHRALWDRCAAVVVGPRPREVGLSNCGVDGFALVREAVARALELGYRRPALVVEAAEEGFWEGRLGAGMWSARRVLPEADRLEDFSGPLEAPADARAFHEWRLRARPDVLLALHVTTLARRLTEASVDVPREIGLIALDRANGAAEFAGMDPRGDLLGEVAVDLLAGLLATNETGLPATPRSISIGATWSPGPTVRDSRERVASG